VARTEQLAVRTSPERQIRLLVRAGSLARHEPIAIANDEKLLVTSPYGQDRPLDCVRDATNSLSGVARPSHCGSTRHAAIACGKIEATAS
jgi:hypothetical protein